MLVRQQMLGEDSGFTSAEPFPVDDKVPRLSDAYHFVHPTRASIYPLDSSDSCFRLLKQNLLQLLYLRIVELQPLQLKT